MTDQPEAYVLTILLSNNDFHLPISEHEYDAVNKSSINIKQALYIEEKFDLLLGNYLDLELALLEAAAKYMVRPFRDYKTKAAAKNVNINRRLFNLLASCRAYIDHVPQHLGRIVPMSISENSSYKDIFVELTKNEYDHALGYRVMEALRNYMQHNDFPIGVTQRMRPMNRGAEASIMYTHRITLDVGMIKETGISKLRY